MPEITEERKRDYLMDTVFQICKMEKVLEICCTTDYTPKMVKVVNSISITILLKMSFGKLTGCYPKKVIWRAHCLPQEFEFH